MLHKSFLFTFLIFPALAFSQNVEDILHKHAEAMGGLERWQSLKSYRQVFGKQNGSHLTMTCRMPDEITLDFQKGDQQSTKGYDGEHGYLVKNGQYEPMRPGEAIEMAEEPHFYSDLMMAPVHGQEVALMGEEEVDGISCYKLKLKKSSKDEQLYWLNQSTYLIEQTGEYSEDSAHDGIYYKTRLSDYREVDGYVFPFRQSLIPSNRPPIVSVTSSLEVNFSLPEDHFVYQPDNTRNLIAYWKDRYAKNSLKSFTFAQETIRLREGEDPDTSLWYEAIRYPDQFRIDFGHGSEGNINLWRSDSVYVLRKGELVHRGDKVQEALLMKGALYHLPIDTTLSKLRAIGVDPSVFHTAIYEGRPAYVIGAVPESDSIPQIWVDAERRNVLRRSSKLPNGKLLEVRYDDFVQSGGHWLESWVAFYLDGKLIQTERYKDIDVQPELPEGVFEVERFGEVFWY